MQIHRANDIKKALKDKQAWFVYVVLLLGASGCATNRFKSGSGDVSQLILHRAMLSGATPISTNAVSRISNQWRYFEDDNGIVIRMAQSDYPALESFLIETFGQPLKGPNNTPDGGKYGVYRFTSEGGVLQFGRDSVDGTHVEIIRPLTRRESTEAIEKALEDKQVQKLLNGSP